MGSKSEEYRRYGEFCMRMARTTRTMELRASWAALAEQWMALARRIDEYPSLADGEDSDE